MPLNPILERSFDIVGALATQIKVPGNNGLPVSVATETEIGAIKALSGYAARQGILGVIATVLHRIWNAVKAIFGCSDWQNAENTVISIVGRGMSLAALGGYTKEEIAGLQLLITMMGKQFKPKISEGFEAAIQVIDALNEHLPPLEPLILPFIDRFLPTFNTAKVASNVLRLPEIFAELEDMADNNPDDPNLISRIMEKAAQIYVDNGFITQEGLLVVTNFFKSQELAQIVNLVPTLIKSIGTSLGVPPEEFEEMFADIQRRVMPRFAR